MANHRTKAAVIALVAFVGLSANQAFAGLVQVHQENVPESWRIDLSATSGTFGLTGAYDNIRAWIGAPVTYTVTAGTFTINTPSRFEDISSSGGHEAINNFGIRLPGTASTWAQTSIDSTPFGTTLTAAGNLMSTDDQILDFSLFFEGAETDGTHVYVEFYNGNTFVTGYEIKNITVAGGGINGTDLAGKETTNYNVSAVPLPSAVWLGGLTLLGGIGGAAMRRRRNRQILA